MNVLLRVGRALLASAIAVCASAAAQAEVTRIEVAVAHGRSRRQAIRRCRRLREDRRQGVLRRRSCRSAQQGASSISTRRRATPPARSTSRPTSTCSRRRTPRAATALRCSMCSIAGARTCSGISIARPQVSDPTTEAEFGDGFLMQQGYTLVWVGWQFDIPHRGGLMALDAPPVLDQGKPVTGRISTLFTPNTADPTYPLDDMGRYADTTHYPPVDPASAASTLTVRDGFLGAPRTDPARRSGSSAASRTGRWCPTSPRSISRAAISPAISMS